MIDMLGFTVYNLRVYYTLSKQDMLLYYFTKSQKNPYCSLLTINKKVLSFSKNLSLTPLSQSPPSMIGLLIFL